MSYEAQWKLTYDDSFVSRCRACITQQSDNRLTDAAADVAALAASLLRGDNPSEQVTFQNSLGAAPGLADKADNGDGTVNSDRITDLEILSNVQTLYPQIAALYYGPTGTPKTR